MAMPVFLPFLFDFSKLIVHVALNITGSALIPEAIKVLAKV